MTISMTLTLLIPDKDVGHADHDDIDEIEIRPVIDWTRKGVS